MLSRANKTSSTLKVHLNYPVLLLYL